MYRYLIEFVCDINGVRETGTIPVQLAIPIPTLRAAQQFMTEDTKEAVQRDAIGLVTGFTITNIRFA